jgi:hypothetical protein
MATIRSTAVASALAVGLAVAAFPATSQADVYVQTSDHCTGGCGTTTNNTVTVTTTGVANQLLISVQLASGWNFISSGAGGGASFGFSLPQLSLTFTAVNPAAFTATTWEPFPGTSALSPQTVNSAAGNSMDGITFPANFYGMTWLAGNGAANQDGSALSFLISGTGLTLTSFLAGTGGAIFAADVINHNRTVTVDGVTGPPTGIIDFSISQVPLPPAALLFGTALVGMGVLGRRRKKDGLAA